MASTILKAIVIAIISTGGINMIYQTNNAGINSGIIVVISVISYFILSNEQKSREKLINEKNSLKAEEKLKMLDEVKKYYEDYLEKRNHDFEQLKNSSGSLINDLNNRLDAVCDLMKEQNKVSELLISNNNLLSDIKKADEENNVNIINLFNTIKSHIENSSKVFSEFKNEYFKELKKIKEDQSGKFNDIYDSLKDIMITLKKQYECIENISEEKITEIQDRADDIKNIIESESSTINRLRKDFNDRMDEAGEINTNLLNSYEKLYSNSLKQIEELTDKNKTIVQLLDDNYRILNAVIDN